MQSQIQSYTDEAIMRIDDFVENYEKKYEKMNPIFPNLAKKILRETLPFFEKEDYSMNKDFLEKIVPGSLKESKRLIGLIAKPYGIKMRGRQNGVYEIEDLYGINNIHYATYATYGDKISWFLKDKVFGDRDGNIPAKWLIEK